MDGGNILARTRLSQQMILDGGIPDQTIMDRARAGEAVLLRSG